MEAFCSPVIRFQSVSEPMLLDYELHKCSSFLSLSPPHLYKWDRRLLWAAVGCFSSPGQLVFIIAQQVRVWLHSNALTWPIRSCVVRSRVSSLIWASHLFACLYSPATLASFWSPQQASCF